MSKEDEKLIKELIKEFRKNSINKDSINWELFEKKVWESANFSKDTAIVTALTLNGEKHSSYYNQETKSYLYGKSNATYRHQDVAVLDINQDIGYISILSFINSRKSLSETLENGETYIKKTIEAIKEQDSKKLKGWIIDLRKNKGGNMWPMLISLSPFLGNNTLGYFLTDNNLKEWKKQENQIFDGKTNKTKKFLNEPIHYQLNNKDLKIAVIVNSNTASAGEAIAIALKSNPNVKLFGENTAGYTTSNQSIILKNNDILFLTTGVMMDFKKVEYWNGVQLQNQTSEVEALKNEILNWFK